MRQANGRGPFVLHAALRRRRAARVPRRCGPCRGSKTVTATTYERATAVGALRALITFWRFGCAFRSGRAGPRRRCRWHRERARLAGGRRASACPGPSSRARVGVPRRARPAGLRGGGAHRRRDGWRRRTARPLRVWHPMDATVVAPRIPDRRRCSPAIDPATLPMPRARARAFVGLAAALADGLDLADREALLALPGIGPWTADYVALRVLGDRDAWPADRPRRQARAASGSASRTPTRSAGARSAPTP